MATTGRLRWYRDKFDLRRSGAFAVPERSFLVTTADGVAISGSRLEGSGKTAFLVVHGLLAHRRAPGFLQLAESLTRFGPVWTIDLRGHGLSEGACSLGNLEALDVAAATAEVRREGLPVVALGLSMGAAAAVRSAALYEPVDAVVAISSPAEWRGWRGPAARRTALAWRVPGGPALVRALTGVRLRPRLEASQSPAACAARLAPAPLLVVHGADDPFFPPQEARTLFARAAEPRGLWIVEGGGHAEGLFSDPRRPPDRARVDAFAGEVVARLDALRCPGGARRTGG